jgi:hypothetical protein
MTAVTWSAGVWLAFHCGNGTNVTAAAGLPHSTREETARHYAVAANGGAVEPSLAGLVSGRTVCPQHAE